MSTFVVAPTGSDGDQAHVAGAPLRAEVALGVEEGVEGSRVELDPGRELERDHHLVVDRAFVGNAVDRDTADAGEPFDDALDRCRGEVLTVDPDPVGGAAREEEHAVVGPVAEVARPVPAVADALAGGVGVVVVALEPVDDVAADDLTDRDIAR